LRERERDCGGEKQRERETQADFAEPRA